MYRTNKTFFISRALPLSIALLLIFWSIPPTYAQSKCLSVDGLSFEKVSNFQLLAVRDGQNIAWIYTYGSLPGKLGTFRFFSPNLCDSGAEAKFAIDGNLMSVNFIQFFKK